MRGELVVVSTVTNFGRCSFSVSAPLATTRHQEHSVTAIVYIQTKDLFVWLH